MNLTRFGPFPYGPYPPAVMDELEQNRQQAESPEIDNGGAPNNHGFEIRILANHLLGRDLRMTVDFYRVGRVVFAHRTPQAFAPKAIAREKNHVRDTVQAHG